MHGDRLGYSTFEIKAVDDEQRLIEGIASTPTPDRDGDVMVPDGAKYSLPLPLLWQHNSREPIGEVFSAQISKDGIRIKARLPVITEPGRLKDRIDEAWQSLKSRPPLVRGLSIGWRPIEFEPIAKSEFLKHTKWLWGELSAVTIPANVEASITSVKTAALGPNPPGDSGTTTTPGARKAAPVMTIPEQITQFENSRAADSARMTALMSDVAAKGETLDEAGSEEYDRLADRVKSVDAHLVRLKALEKANLAAAVAVPAAAGVDSTKAADVRGGHPVITVKSNVPPGMAFTRYVMCIAGANGDSTRALERAKRSFGDTPEVELLVKAAIVAGDTTTSGWATELAVQQPLNDFITLLRPRTLLGRIPNLRRVPFNVSVPAQTAGGTYGWVGQGKVNPLTKLTTATVTLAINKIAGIIVLTQELVKISSPSAQELVQTDLIEGIRKYMDEQFIDPSVAGSGTVSPASITNGTSAVTSAGTSNDNLRTDLKAVMSSFLTNNLSLENSVWLMSEANAFAAMMAINALGAPLFPGMQNTGNPILFGRPVVTSQSAATTVALVDAQGVLVADDGGVTIDISKEASLQMDSAPDDPPTASTVFVSMFQQNMVALRAERFVTWKRARTASVKYVAQTYV